jgi:SsrA-binding protein
MADAKRNNLAPRISNRKAHLDYFIEAKLECGIALTGSEVKSLRNGKASIGDAFARVEGNHLILYDAHIDMYDQASYLNHLPKRERVLLAHKREIKKLEKQTAEKGVTLIPLAFYFKDGKVKVELAVARGKQMHDKRATIKENEMKRELKRQMTKRM